MIDSSRRKRHSFIHWMMCCREKWAPRSILRAVLRIVSTDQCCQKLVPITTRNLTSLVVEARVCHADFVLIVSTKLVGVITSLFSTTRKSQ